MKIHGATRGVACGLLAAQLGLGGCSTVESQQYDVTTTPVASGPVYYLPMRTFDIDAKFVVSDCAATSDGRAALTYDVQPVVRAQLVADRERAFAISKGLNGRFLKAMNFEITLYENGTLKAINAVADDRTAESATNVVTGALKMALGLTGLGLLSSEEATPGFTRFADLRPEAGAKKEVLDANKAILKRLRLACGDKLTDALLQVRTLTSQLDGAAVSTEAKSKLTAAVTAAEKTLTDARSNLKAAKDTANADDLARAQAGVNDAVKKLAEAQKKVDDFPASAAPTALQQRIAAYVQRDLTFTASARYVPLENKTSDIKKILYDQAALNAEGVNVAEDMTATVTFALHGGRGPANDPMVPDYEAETAEGVWTRAPATGLMQVCVKACNDRTVRLSQAFSAPQWGQLSVLPLKSMAMSRSTIKVAFAPDGAITSLYFDTTAPAERASGAFATVGQSVLDYSVARRQLQTELDTAATAAQKANLQRQIDLIDLQATLASAQAGTTGAQARQISDLDFQIEEKQKQIKLLEESKKLEALQAGMAANTP